MPAWIDSMRIRLYLPFMNRLYADELYALAGQAFMRWSISSTNVNEAGRNDGRHAHPMAAGRHPIAGGAGLPAFPVGSRAVEGSAVAWALSSLGSVVVFAGRVDVPP